MSRAVNTNLAYRCQMLPQHALDSRSAAERELLKVGWSQKELGQDLDGALAWARSHVIVSGQEIMRKRRQAKSRTSAVRPDDALDEMFKAVGADPTTIPRRAVR